MATYLEATSDLIVSGPVGNSRRFVKELEAIRADHWL